MQVNLLSNLIEGDLPIKGRKYSASQICVLVAAAVVSILLFFVFSLLAYLIGGQFFYCVTSLVFANLRCPKPFAC